MKALQAFPSLSVSLCQLFEIIYNLDARHFVWVRGAGGEVKMPKGLSMVVVNEIVIRNSRLFAN
jgi:hypothetical protein